MKVNYLALFVTHCICLGADDAPSTKVEHPCPKKSKAKPEDGEQNQTVSKSNDPVQEEEDNDKSAAISEGLATSGEPEFRTSEL